MKSGFFCLLVLTALLGCRQDTAAPDDSLLYRTWKITTIQYQTGNPVDVSPTNQWAIVTFTPNGMILYGTDGKYEACCSPARFKRKRMLLDLADVASIPLPERTPNGLCVMASCIPPEGAWQINRLTKDELVIKQSYATVSYQPYP